MKFDMLTVEKIEAYKMVSLNQRMQKKEEDQNKTSKKKGHEQKTVTNVIDIKSTV